MPIIQSFLSPPPSPHIQSAEFSVFIGGTINVQPQSATGANFRVSIGGEINVTPEFVFEIPAPFIDEIENPTARVYTARLKDNFGNRILITDAQISQPKGEIGERVSLTVAEKDLNQVSTDKTYTFEVGEWSSVQDAVDGLPPAWKTVCENARLAGRSFSELRRGKTPTDSLTFDIIESSKNRLNFFPVRNYILYDSLKTDVNLDEQEKEYTSDGDYIKTTANAFPNLTFYKILQFVRERCGFAGFETDLPNFPVIRADFPFDRSYARSLAGIGGMYEIIYSIQPGNILRAQTKYAQLEDGFTPQTISGVMSPKSLQITQSTHVDGIRIIYSDTGAADYSEDRLVQTFETTGTFGNPDFTRTDIERTYRDWFVTGNDSPVRTELVEEIHETLDASLVLIGRETNTHTYDAQGRRTNSSREIESRVPNLADNGNLLLQTVREENQTVFYTTDPKNSRRSFQSKTVTQISGLISIDADNPYFNEPAKQDILLGHKALNLNAEMSSEFGLIKTITETLTPLGNNQFEMRTIEIDHINGFISNPVSEPKTGDASLNSVGGRARRFVLWADGIGINSRTGGELIELAAGELPLKFAKVLGEIILHRRVNGFQEGSVTVSGYNETFTRGSYLSLYSRENEYLGRFVVEAVNANFNNLGVKNGQIVTTILQISEV